MGRNDLCFCGSGKKQKKCHPNINEDSVAAKIIKLYTQLSKELEENVMEKRILNAKKDAMHAVKIILLLVRLNLR